MASVDYLAEGGAGSVHAHGGPACTRERRLLYGYGDSVIHLRMEKKKLELKKIAVLEINVVVVGEDRAAYCGIL